MSAPGYQISRDPTAVIGARTAAWIVDLLLYVVLVIGVLGPTPLSPLAEYAPVPDGMSMETACDRVGDLEDDVSSCLLIGDRVYFTDSSDALIQLVGWLLYVGLIYVVWQGVSGLSPGKLLFGLRTVGEDGRAPGMGRAFIRSVLWVVDGFPWCIPGLVGFFVGLTSTGHRRVGDMAAKTFVVGKADAGQPVMVPGLTTGTYGPQTAYGQPGYGAPVPGQAPWGAGPGAPGAPGAPSWGTPPAAPPPPASPYPPADRPAPPTSPYGTPAAPPAPVPESTAPTAPAPESPSAPTPDAFGESSDPAEADLPSGDAESTSSDTSTTSDEAPASDSSADAPASTEATAPTVETGAGAAATAEQTYSPQWDAARGAYIQWDPNRSRWLQWDDTAKEWKTL